MADGSDHQRSSVQPVEDGHGHGHRMALAGPAGGAAGDPRCPRPACQVTRSSSPQARPGRPQGAQDGHGVGGIVGGAQDGEDVADLVGSPQQGRAFEPVGDAGLFEGVFERRRATSGPG